MDYEGADLYTGMCVGGPMNGQEAHSRSPKGILVCDRDADKAWLYDWDGKAFICRDPVGMALLDDDDETVNSRQRAARESDYDVIAAPWLPGSPVGDQEQLDGEDVDDDNSGS